MMKQPLAFILSLFSAVQICSAQTTPARIQNLFHSNIFLRRVWTSEQANHFEACDRIKKTCQVITRDLTPDEMKAEKIQLEKKMHYRFRDGLPVGAVAFSDSMLCTVAGVVIPAVPGFAGGAVICLLPETHKIHVRELPLNIQALDRLSEELGDKTDLVAKGDDGDSYYANISFIIKYLKERFPLPPDPVISPSSHPANENGRT